MIPCFGVHPWFAHLHDMAGPEAPQEQQQQPQAQPHPEHQHLPKSAQQQQQQQQHLEQQKQPQDSGNDSSPLPPVAHLLEPSPKDDPRRHPHLAALHPTPAAQWLPRLRQLLTAHPEVGRSACWRSNSA